MHLKQMILACAELYCSICTNEMQATCVMWLSKSNHSVTHEWPTLFPLQHGKVLQAVVSMNTWGLPTV
jgi:hypothetical protein